MSLKELSVTRSPDLLQGISESDRQLIRQGRVLLAGLGNIGSFLSSLFLAPLVGSLKIVDRDFVDGRNSTNQFYFEESAVGRFKSDYLADWLRARHPHLAVESYPVDLEDLPISTFDDVDLVLGGLDSLRARQILISERAYPLGKPVIDGGVGDPLIARVHLFLPRGGEGACAECLWGDAEYRALAAEYPCTPGADAQAPPTHAPALLGATVAGMMAAEAVNLLAGRTPDESRELHFDFFHRRFLQSKLRRNSKCRFHHAVIRERISLEVPFEQATASDLLRTLSQRFGTRPVSLTLRRGILTDLVQPGADLAASQLERVAELPLKELGFTRHDWIRAQTETGDQRVFVLLHQEHADDTGSNP